MEGLLISPRLIFYLCLYCRPDVLSKYHVYMEGSKTAFPTLLCNGNLLSSGDVAEDNSRHFAVWDDPFPKPSYLFGLVAGPLVSLTG